MKAFGSDELREIFKVPLSQMENKLLRGARLDHTFISANLNGFHNHVAFKEMFLKCLVSPLEEHKQSQF